MAENPLSTNDQPTHVGLGIGGIITLFVAAGLAAFGWFMSAQDPDILVPLLGVALLVGIISIGLLSAGSYAKRQHDDM